MVISEAHGTDYFSDAVNQLRKNPPAPKGKPIRGDLLAALLLMGDELHLHEERVSECLRWEIYKMEHFPPLSLLHIFRHHYINLVEVGGQGDFERKIILRFQFPKDSENYADQIIKWVVTKLRRQCFLTQDILQSSTGLFWYDEPQVVLMEDSRRVRDSLPPVAHRCLEKETLERPLVNREELLDKLKGYLKNPHSGNEVFIAWGEEDSDLNYLVDWLQAACECYPGVCLPYLSCYDGGTFGEDYIRSETEALLQPESRGILIIKNLQYMAEPVKRWLLDKWLVTITAPEEGRKNIVVIFGENGQPSLPSSLNSSILNLHNFSEADIIKTLIEKLACPTAEAQRHARSWLGNNFTPNQVINSIRFVFGES